MRSRIAALEAEIARLRAGEEPYTDELTDATPGQYIWLWNRAPAAKRLSMAAQILDSGQRAYTCVMYDHEGRIELVSEYRQVLMRVEELAERWQYYADRKDGPLRELRDALKRPS